MVATSYLIRVEEATLGRVVPTEASFPQARRSLQIIDPELPTSLFPLPPGADSTLGPPPVYASDVSVKLPGRWLGNATTYGGVYEGYGINLGSGYTVDMQMPRFCHKVCSKQGCDLLEIHENPSTFPYPITFDPPLPHSPIPS
jgi:hypothetical protein